MSAASIRAVGCILEWSIRAWMSHNPPPHNPAIPRVISVAIFKHASLVLALIATAEVRETKTKLPEKL